MNSAAFARAEAHYLSPPEVSPAQEEWENGREEIAEFYQDVNDVLEDINYTSVDTVDDLDASIALIKALVAQLESYRDDIAELEDKYPAEDWEPDFDYDFWEEDE